MNVLIRREEMILFVMKILINFIKRTRFLFIKDFLLSILFSFEFKYFLIIYFLFSNRLIYTFRAQSCCGYVSAHDLIDTLS